MPDSTFRAPEDRCYMRTSCPGYIEGLCFNINHLENDEWCVLNSKLIQQHVKGTRTKYVRN